MNAKERRKLLRVQQRAVEKETEAPVRNEVELKPKEIKKGEQEVNPQEATSVEGQKDEQQGDVTQLNSKQRRLLLRKQKRDTEGNSNEEKGIQTKPRKKRKRQEIKENKLAPVISVAESNESNDDDNADEKNKKNKIHRTLFVGQLPFKCTEELIRKHFEEAGDIQVRMLTDKKTNKFRGLAFIEVKDNKALGAALSRHHTLLNGRRINVELTAGGGGTKSTKRKEKIETMRKKQSVKQIEKTRALVQKHVDAKESKLVQDDVDERMVDFLSWFDYETAKKALDEFSRCVTDRVLNRKAFMMGILKRFRQTDGVEDERSSSFKRFKPYNNNKKRK